MYYFSLHVIYLRSLCSLSWQKDSKPCTNSKLCTLHSEGKRTNAPPFILPPGSSQIGFAWASWGWLEHLADLAGSWIRCPCPTSDAEVGVRVGITPTTLWEKTNKSKGFGPSRLVCIQCTVLVSFWFGVSGQCLVIGRDSLARTMPSRGKTLVLSDIIETQDNLSV